eukprot:1748089-Karenia_brevis.AAC.1
MSARQALGSEGAKPATSVASPGGPAWPLIVHSSQRALVEHPSVHHIVCIELALPRQLSRCN